MRRKQRGQSMVEYALGIGCVAATAMLALQGVGMESCDILRQVILSINDADDATFATDPSGSTVVKQNSTPWTPN